jgi:hypothetical protein
MVSFTLFGDIQLSDKFEAPTSYQLVRASSRV